MNYNNYNNPYNQYPYTAYGNGAYQQPMQPQQNYQQMQYQQPQQQTNYLPLTFVNGVEGAKAFIVGANQIIYLKDSDSNILFEKKADAQGKYTLNAFELKQVDINNIGKDTNSNPISTDRFIMKDDIKDFVKTSDLNALETLFESKIDKLSSRIEKLARQGYNKPTQKDSE
ncbi:MAG: hypothetical protein J6Q15_01700 [Clostridia bacterium]|nr:hypothetical protein [Clostridia bacterium]